MLAVVEFNEFLMGGRLGLYKIKNSLNKVQNFPLNARQCKQLLEQLKF